MSFLKFMNIWKMNYFSLFFLVLLVSCGSRKEVVYFQNSTNNVEINSIAETVFKSDDLLRIFINTKDVEASTQFNLPALASIINQAGVGQVAFQTYLVDSEGYIEFPVLGKLKVAGLKRLDFIDNLKQQLKPFLKSEPIINITILNFKISVSGEVTRPGSYIINSERITLPEALALAGDLTIFGKRSNILVLRDLDGVKTINKVDITKTDFINSEFFYLTQNDMIYVEPNRTRVNAAAIGPNAVVIISGLSLLITVVALLIR